MPRAGQKSGEPFAHLFAYNSREPQIFSYSIVLSVLVSRLWHSEQTRHQRLHHHGRPATTLLSAARASAELAEWTGAARPCLAPGRGAYALDSVGALCGVRRADG